MKPAYLKNSDVLRKAKKTNFLSSLHVCATVKPVAANSEDPYLKYPKINANVWNLICVCKPRLENGVLKYQYGFVTLLWTEDRRKLNYSFKIYWSTRNYISYILRDTLSLPHLFILASSWHPPSCSAIWGPVQKSHWRINSHSNEIPLPPGGRMTSVK